MDTTLNTPFIVLYRYHVCNCSPANSMSYKICCYIYDLPP